jgi:hypothetical protein
MRLVNRTGVVAYLQAVNLLEPELRAAVIIKKTYTLGLNGALVPAEESLPLVPEQLVTDFGQFHGEVFFRKRGIDVCVLGTARFDKRVTHARLSLEVGRWKHELRLTGDRVWTKKRGGELVPSAPVPFHEMPVSYARAYGGTAEVNGEDVSFPDNPVGRGYYETPEQALGKPLPNIEPLNAPVEPRWDTRIPVAGWGPYPMYWGLRASRAVKIDPKTGELLEVSPELFNHAHPELILERLEPGSPIRLLGLRPAPLSLAVPRERPRVLVRVGGAVSEAFGELDGLFVWADALRVVVTWRARFRYAVRNEELRSAELSFVE